MNGVREVPGSLGISPADLQRRHFEATYLRLPTNSVTNVSIIRIFKMVRSRLST